MKTTMTFTAEHEAELKRIAALNYKKMDKVFILKWIPNTQFTVRAGIFSNIEKVINHIEKSIYKSKFTNDDFEKIKQLFTENNYLYEDKIISIECCYVD